MKKYEIRKNTREISYKNKSEIKEGCTIDVEHDQYPEIISSFDDEQEALNELEHFHSEICRLSGGAGPYYHVTEFYVEENKYNEDGEWEDGGNILKFSRLPNFEN